MIASTGPSNVPSLVWVGGRLAPLEEPALRADDSAYAQGLGCYTTARVEAGRIRHGGRAARRLARDAARLGLGEVDEALCQRAIRELAEACFGTQPGIVRVQASSDGRRGVQLIATARPIGEEPDRWRADISRHAHQGPGPMAGVKLSGHPLISWVRRELRQAGLDESLLCDPSGRLVEGARSSPILCDSRGRLSTPPLNRGGVEGVAREILLERVPDLLEEDISRDELNRAREVVAVNSVRGARAIVEIDGAVVGDGRPGPWARRLGAVLDAEE